MTRPIVPYTPQKIAEIRSWVKACPTWLEAREVIAEKLKVHSDNVTKMHKRHGFWTPPAGAPEASVSTTTRTDGFDVDVQLSKAATLDEVMHLCKVDTDLW